MKNLFFWIRCSVFFLSIVFVSYAQETERKAIIIGYVDHLDITKESADIICLGIEANHPLNHCGTKFLTIDEVFNALKKDEVSLALLPEEVLLSSDYKKNYQPYVIAPIYQEYFYLVGSRELTTKDLSSLRDRIFGVLDSATKSYRVKPILESIGVRSEDIYYPMMANTEKMKDQFCYMGLDGVVLMSMQSSRLVRELTAACDAKIMRFTQQQVDAITKKYPWFYSASIPKEYYWGLDNDVLAVSSRVILVARNNKALINEVSDSLNHVVDELMTRDLHYYLRPEEVLESYEKNPIVLKPEGELLIKLIKEGIQEERRAVSSKLKSISGRNNVSKP